MKSVLMSVLAVICLAGLAIAQDSSNIYINPTLGISLEKPEEWYFISAEQAHENLRNIEMSDEEFQKLVLKHATAPIVAMTKYPEPHDDLNPSFKVNIRPLGKLPADNPSMILQRVLPSFEKAFEGFSLEEGPTDTLVSGMKASYARIHYNLMVSDSTGYPTCSEMWIVPKGRLLFMIGAGTNQKEKADTREEITAILSSLKLHSD